MQRGEKSTGEEHKQKKGKEVNLCLSKGSLTFNIQTWKKNYICSKYIIHQKSLYQRHETLRSTQQSEQ